MVGEPVGLDGQRGAGRGAGPALRRAAGGTDRAAAAGVGEALTTRRSGRAPARRPASTRARTRSGSMPSPPRSCSRKRWTRSVRQEIDRGGVVARGKARSSRSPRGRRPQGVAGGGSCSDSGPADPPHDPGRHGRLVLVEAAAPLQGLRGRREVVTVEPGMGAGQILDKLQAEGVLADAKLARSYLIYFLDDPADPGRASTASAARSRTAAGPAQAGRAARSSPARSP